MFWIYIPPIILVVALTILIILLGKKAAQMKKTGILDEVAEAPKPVESTELSRGKRIISTLSKLLEKILVGVKALMKNSENAVASWAAKLKARRSGKIENLEVINPKEHFVSTDILTHEDDFLSEIDKTEEIIDLQEGRDNGNYLDSSVVVRRKMVEAPLPKLRLEPMPEDKVKEEALIHRIAESPKDIEAYRELGDYYLAIGNIKDAKDSFKMVLKLRPRDLKAKSSLREIEMKMRLGS